VTQTPSPTATQTKALEGASLPRTSSASAPDRWIEIDLSEQTLTAYQGGTAVLKATVSTGKRSTPTPLGEFAIYARVPIQDMGGPGYHMPDVRYVVYFEGDYAIHAAYWHDSFGQPVSHGCVNMRTADARALYEWAQIGTPVRVHD
jgi:lipoprotein-anchoring transpeptidase ErfK/SrfK